MGQQVWVYNGTVFKAGDEVVVWRNDPDSMGNVVWMNCWVDGMNDAIGQQFVISHIDDRGAFFADLVGEDKRLWPDDEGYGYPLSSLVHLERCVVQ